MADTISAVYDFTLPEVGASEETWGAKLNANWAKMETLFSGAFTGGSATTLGELKSANMPDTIDKPITWHTSIIVENTAPYIRLHDTQAVDPAGQWRMYAISDNLYFQRQLTANWATYENAMYFNGTTKEVIISAPYSLQLSTTAVEIAASNAELRFRETDQAEPGGRYRFLASGGGFYLQKATAADWTTAINVWGYSPTTGVATFSAAAAFTGDVRITNTQPVLWLQETDATGQKDWGFWASSSLLRIGTASTAGAPVTTLVGINDANFQVFSDYFRIQSSYPTIVFADTTPSGDQYFNITGGNGVMRFNFADSAGATVEQMAALSRSGGLAVNGNISAAGAITATGGNVTTDGRLVGELYHPDHRGYVNIGAYSSTYGSGYGKFYWNQTANSFVFQGDIDATTFMGSGAGLTGITAAQVGLVSAAGAVKSYAFARSNSNVSFNSTTAGSSLHPNNASGSDSTDGNALSGTWRCMGRSDDGASGGNTTLWYRIS